MIEIKIKYFYKNNLKSIKSSHELSYKLKYTIVSTAEFPLKWMIITKGCGVIMSIELSLVSGRKTKYFERDTCKLLWSI